jgi:hypothetical protein
VKNKSCIVSDIFRRLNFKYMDYLKIDGMFAGATAETRPFDIRLRANTTESEMKLWNYLKTKHSNY